MINKGLLTIVILASAITAFAQVSLKIGHINSQELILAMPENDSAIAILGKASKDLQDQYQMMQDEYNSKIQDFITKRDSYSELIKQTKNSELQSMEQRIQQFQQNAEQDLQLKRADIYKPILNKANKAISEVAKESGFTYILDLAQGTVLYHDETSMDIFPLVKQKLGLPNKSMIPSVKK
jgi:outer membrane protein